MKKCLQSLLLAFLLAIGTAGSPAVPVLAEEAGLEENKMEDIVEAAQQPVETEAAGTETEAPKEKVQEAKEEAAEEKQPEQTSSEIGYPQVTITVGDESFTGQLIRFEIVDQNGNLIAADLGGSAVEEAAVTEPESEPDHVTEAVEEADTDPVEEADTDLVGEPEKRTPASTKILILLIIIMLFIICSLQVIVLSSRKRRKERSREKREDALRPQKNEQDDIYDPMNHRIRSVSKTKADEKSSIPDLSEGLTSALDEFIEEDTHEKEEKNFQYFLYQDSRESKRLRQQMTGWNPDSYEIMEHMKRKDTENWNAILRKAESRTASFLLEASGALWINPVRLAIQENGKMKISRVWYENNMIKYVYELRSYQTDQIQKPIKEEITIVSIIPAKVQRTGEIITVNEKGVLYTN